MDSEKVNFLRGFIAGEGSFFIKIARRTDRDVGFEIRAEFQIQLHESDIVLLQKLRNEFELGEVYDRSDEFAAWRISSLQECRQLTDILNDVPFDSAFRTTEKYRSYRAWEKALEMISNSRHLEFNGAREIAWIRETMNRDGRGHSAEEIVDELNKIQSKQSSNANQATVAGDTVAGDRDDVE